MAAVTKPKWERVPWRELPGWLGVVIAIIGIFLTYWEIRTANERELVFRIWDDARELHANSIDFPGNSSRSQVVSEGRLLDSIQSHSGLLRDRSLKQAANGVSRAWSIAHLKSAEDRSELTCEIGNMLDLMAETLGTYDPVELPSDEPLCCCTLADP